MIHTSRLFFIESLPNCYSSCLVYKSVDGNCPDPATNQEANKIGDDYVNGVLYTFTSIGETVFYCAAGNGFHCAAGQIVKFNVVDPDDATESPSSAPTMNKIIQFAGDPCRGLSGERGNCIACTGDCDRDSDCLGDLRCAQRRRSDGLEEVPGCSFLSGDPLKMTNHDFCFEPQVVEPGFANYIGECGTDNGYLCGECEGHCVTDDDCKSGLVCKYRGEFKTVGGCVGGQPSDMLYNRRICVKAPTSSPSPSYAPSQSHSLTSESPSELSSVSVKPSSLPSASPSSLPSVSPTNKPSSLPSAVVFMLSTIVLLFTLVFCYP